MRPLNETQIAVLSALPEVFSAKQAQQVATNLGLSSRWFNIACRNATFRSVIRGVHHGWYRKLLPETELYVVVIPGKSCLPCFKTKKEAMKASGNGMHQVVKVL